MDEILQRFIADARSKRGRLMEVAEGSGVHPKVLRNILYGETRDPRSSNVAALRAYYERREQESA
jgi:hypothetical protein